MHDILFVYLLPHQLIYCSCRASKTYASKYMEHHGANVEAINTHNHTLHTYTHLRTQTLRHSLTHKTPTRTHTHTHILDILSACDGESNRVGWRLDPCYSDDPYRRCNDPYIFRCTFSDLSLDGNTNTDSMCREWNTMMVLHPQANSAP